MSARGGEVTWDLPDTRNNRKEHHSHRRRGRRANEPSSWIGPFGFLFEGPRADGYCEEDEGPEAHDGWEGEHDGEPGEGVGVSFQGGGGRGGETGQ